MKHYYAAVNISYSDSSGEKIIIGEENYSMILQATSIKDAINTAKREAKKIFDEEINDCFTNINVNVEECYETSEDTRAS
jgi:hypothetical protein